MPLLVPEELSITTFSTSPAFWPRRWLCGSELDDDSHDLIDAVSDSGLLPLKLASVSSTTPRL
jgi:hypothetical protein